MNKKLVRFSERVKGKKIAVIGIGISNVPLIKFLIKQGAKIWAYDKKEKEQLGQIYTELSELGVCFNLGESYLDEINEDIIFKTPGMRYDNPALLKARERGAWITSEMEVFFDVCPAKIIAVTGSDGKTTTTTLINKFLVAAGYKTRLGGNIGRPLIGEIDEITSDEWIVLELSSFQLHTMRKSPDIAVITNITPNHLDWHTDYNEYIEAKKNIMRYQSENCKVVLNSNNEETAKLIGNANGEVITFSAYRNADIYIKDGSIYNENEKLLDIAEIKIPGMHNVENYMTAIAAVCDLVPKSVFCEVANSFGGVEHRIELVRILDGVKYYNSSIDSSPNRSINTLRVFGNNVIMIAGGKDKGIPYDEIGPCVVEHVKSLVLIGKTADKIEAAVKKADRGDKVRILHANTYPEAVNLAKNEAAKGDVVILSPASTSFDMFNNFEERGNLFKEIVLSL
ncbi:MAG: UDP-N-acetylmuramoyl-L-alanine--D-glutamate ligase [Clostridia bacterium]|nr:UDP-N-acetylmuramoyl-L-alanine--D-glutamate ligase [Clostridia bacterium]